MSIFKARTWFHLSANFSAEAATILVAVSFIFMPAVAHANALEQFKRFVTETRSARGEFNQRMVKGEGDKLRVSGQSSGTFAFSRPGKFIWNYKKPYEQVLQSDGNNMYIHDQDLNQVTVRALGNAIGSSPAAILFGSNDLEKNFAFPMQEIEMASTGYKPYPKPKIRNSNVSASACAMACRWGWSCATTLVRCPSSTSPASRKTRHCPPISSSS